MSAEDPSCTSEWRDYVEPAADLAAYRQQKAEAEEAVTYETVNHIELYPELMARFSAALATSAVKRLRETSATSQAEKNFSNMDWHLDGHDDAA